MKNLRGIAYKVWVGDLLGAEFVRTTGEMEPNYFKIRDLQVSRVNLIGVVVEKIEGESSIFLSLDDGSGTISLRVWKEDRYILEGWEIGDLVIVIGKAREFNNSAYVLPEVVRKLDSYDWFKLRKIELEKEFGKAVKSDVDISVPVVEESVVEVASNEDRGVVLSLIESLDVGEGVDVNMVVSDSNLSEEKVKIIVSSLLKEGEVFELKPGRMRVLP